LPDTVTVIYFSFADREWALQTRNTVETTNPPDDAIPNLCRTESTCWGAVAFTSTDGFGYVFAAVQTIPDANHTLGGLESHEFTHNIQQAQYFKTPKYFMAWCCEKAYVPWYFPEGEASYIQDLILSTSSLDTFKRYHNQNIVNIKNYVKYQWKGDISFDQSYIENYLNPKIGSSDRQMWDAFPRDFEYSIGYLVTEYLVAARGVDSMMRMRQRIATGKEYPEAFESIYGLAWNDAVPLLAAYIWSEFNR
jgi:hypothetical protein